MGVYRVLTVAALLMLRSGSVALAAEGSADPALAILNKASRDPIVIRAQADLGRRYAQQLLERLSTAASAETQDSVHRTLHAAYTQLSLAVSGVRLKLIAEKNARLVNPMLDKVEQGLENATTDIRNGIHLSYSFSVDRTDLIEQLIRRLQAAVTRVEQVIDLI